MIRPLAAAVLATTFATLVPAQAAPSRAPRPEREPAAGADLQQELGALRTELRELRRMLDQLTREQRADASETPRARNVAPTPNAEPKKAEKAEKGEKAETKTRSRTFTISSDQDGKWVEVAPSKDGPTKAVRGYYYTGDRNQPLVLRADGTTINLAPGVYQVENGEQGETKVFTFDVGSGKAVKAKAKAAEPVKSEDGKCSCGCDCDCCKQNAATNKRTVVSLPQSLFAPHAVALRAGMPTLGTMSGVLAPSGGRNFTLFSADRNCSPTRGQVMTPMTAPVPPTPPKAPKAPKPPKAPKVKDADRSKLISV